MALNPSVMQAVEKLGYRVTVGDVASQAGLEIVVAEQGLLALASAAGGHLQVAESGEVAYLFPRNFRDILRNQSWRLRWQETWKKIWRILFYLIRVSFGIVLIASIILIFLSIAIIFIVITSKGDGDSGSSDNSGDFFSGLWVGSDWIWIFTPSYGDDYSTPRRKARSGQPNQLNFLEAVFSFLFGDGDPNTDLETKRWRTIGTVIRNNRGAVIAEQISPYLDDVGQSFQQEYEDYMLPVLSRFNGRPEVSPEGQLVYHFPELQVKAAETQSTPVAAYLRESSWKFSQASSGQILGAIGLGGLNLVGALMLGKLLMGSTIATDIGGLVAFVAGIYWVLLVYGIGFLSIPLIRYFWVQQRNKRIEGRNQQRQQRAVDLNEAMPQLQPKLAFAQQFALEQVVSEADLAYTTEKDLTEQELAQADRIDAEWQQRLEQSGS
ncbi:MAG TPA: hypothetical protein V6C65_15415 [Allocoleopsis sp.]